MRYHLLDDLRGAALLNMIAYHAIWDMVYLFGFDWPWYQSQGAYYWQQGICWTFIALSGFCVSLGRHNLRRGLTVFLAGVLISLVTGLLMPDSRILFGVLTLIGSCMLLMLPVQRLLQRCPPAAGLALSLGLFLLTKGVPQGSLGFGSRMLLLLPPALYRNAATAFFGFPPPAFFSTDYFPLVPWLFLFMAGYFLFQLLHRRNALQGLTRRGLRPLEWLGRHSLPIYLLHQPLIYLLLSAVLR